MITNHPLGPPMTLGNMRRFGVERLALHLRSADDEIEPLNDFYA
jgi:hypothetical protein